LLSFLLGLPRSLTSLAFAQGGQFLIEIF